MVFWEKEGKLCSRRRNLKKDPEATWYLDWKLSGTTVPKFISPSLRPLSRSLFLSELVLTLAKETEKQMFLLVMDSALSTLAMTPILVSSQALVIASQNSSTENPALTVCLNSMSHGPISISLTQV